MLPTNFAHTAHEAPHLLLAVQSIEKWCASHEDLNNIDPRRVASDLNIAPAQLVDALYFLVSAGVFKQVFKFETPEENFAPGEFQNYHDVPEILRDRADRRVRRIDGKIIPVFQGAK